MSKGEVGTLRVRINDLAMDKESTLLAPLSSCLLTHCTSMPLGPTPAVIWKTCRP